MAANQKNPDEILHQAIKIAEPAEQKDFLDKACKGNESLRAEVESLLKAYAKSGDFLESPAIDPDMTVLMTPLTEKPGTVVGRYRLLEKIGEGGMAVVYMAEQNEPIRRKVALKIIKLGLDTKEVIARFEAERQALAMMDHPNIAKVLDAGTTQTGRPYFVMELVRGIAITEYCDKNNLSTKKRLALFIQVCHAIQHAHQKGIIHRDVKPSNVLVTARDGSPVPKVIDFGIAKATNQRLTQKTVFTRFAQMIGTPAYMSPEQAEMSELDVDTRTDVYSLGVLLYELLTGSTPFDPDQLCKAGYGEIQRIIRETQPPKPSTRLTTLGQTLTDVAKHRSATPDVLRKAVRGDLDWIVMKALEKDRTLRYNAALELSAEIQRHLNNEPVQAGAPSTSYKMRKFIRRHRAGVTAGSLVAAGLLLALVISIGMALWAVSEKRTAQQQAEALRRSLYVNRIHLSDKYLLEENIKQVHDLLKACPDDLRGWEWYYLWKKSNQAGRSSVAFEPVYIRSDYGVWYLGPLALGPGGSQIAYECNDHTIMVWDINSTREPLMLRGHEDGLWSAAFSPDGERIASCSSDKTIKIWDAEKGGEPLRTLVGHNGDVLSVAFSPDGRQIASGSDDTIMVWDINSTREPPLTLRGHQDTVCSVAFSPDGKRIVSGSRDMTIKIWDAEKGGEPLSSTIGHNNGVGSVAFNPDGRQIVSVGADGAIKSWDVNSTSAQLTLLWYDDVAYVPKIRVDRRATGGGVVVFRLDEKKLWTGYGLAFSPDGRQIASRANGFSGTSTIKIWARSGRELATLQGDKGVDPIIAFSPDGKQIVYVTSYDNTVRFWDVNSTSEPLTLRGHTAPVVSASFSPDGKRIASVDMRAVKISDTRTGSELATLGGLFQSAVAFSSDGRRIATADYDGTIKIWDADNYRQILTLRKSGGTVESVAFSPDGARLVSGGGDEVNIWDAEKGGEPLRTLDADYSGVKHYRGGIRCVAFSPDGGRIAYGDYNGTIKIWDAEKGSEPLRTLIGHNNVVYSVAFSPDGRQIASAGVNTIKIWDVKSTSEPLTLRGFGASVAFSPDGERIVSGSTGGKVRIWDAQSGSELITLRGHKYAVTTVAFSPDGKQIASVSGGTVKLWSVADSQALSEEGPANDSDVRRTQAADTETRARPLTLLSEFGTGNPQSQARLFEMLADPSPRVVYGALEVLWMTEPEPTSTIPKIIPFLNNANTRVRVEASYTLGWLAPIPASLLQPPVKALSDKDGTVRANAARAIGLSGTSSEDVFSALVGLLQDSNPVTRFRAAEALARLLGPDALSREPLLSQVIREAELSSNNYFRLVGFNAQTALGKEGMSNPEAVKLFSRLLCNSCAYIRSDALAGLMFRLERSASRIPPEIETLLRAAEHDDNSFVRFHARSILDRWGNLPEEEFEPSPDFQ